MPFALRPAASTSPSLKPRGVVSGAPLISVSFTVPGAGVTIHCPSGRRSIVHCWSSQNSASAPKRRSTALPISVRMPICRDSPPEATSRILSDMSFEPVAIAGFVVAPGVSRGRRSDFRARACTCRRRRRSGFWSATAEGRSNRRRRRSRFGIGREAAVENRAHLGVARGGGIDPKQRGRLDVIRSSTLRIFGLILLPVRMHADQELVQNQTAREDVRRQAPEPPHESCARSIGSCRFQRSPDTHAMEPCDRRAPKNQCRSA